MRTKKMANIMIADDSPLMQNMVKLLLEREGHNIIAMSDNGERTLELYEEFRPDLTILDLRMPKKDGLEVCREIIENNGNARIIIVTGMGEEIKEKAYEAGASNVLLKPFDKVELLEAVESVNNSIVY